MERKRDTKALLRSQNDTPVYHWDYVMKEMTWLATDFQRERSRHAANAKKLVRATELYIRNKDHRENKKNKEELLNLKRTASKTAREVKKYWLKINQLISLRQKQESELFRQKAMDKHLEYLTRQTEKYAMTIVGLNRQTDIANDISAETYDRESIPTIDKTASSTISTNMLVDAEEDDEFQPDDAEDDIDNDSTLLEQEEEERRLASTTGKDPVRDEIDALQQEADLPIEELLARYKQRAKEEDEEEDEYDMESEADRESDGSSDHNHIVEDSSLVVRRKRKIHDSGLDDTASAAKNGKNGEEGQNYSEDQHIADMLVDAEEDDEFQPDDAEDDIDNDSTLLEQEEEERRLASTTGKDPVRDEIDALQQEADLPIEELLARYKQRAKEEDEEEDEYDMESEADRESDGSSDHNHIVEDSSLVVRRKRKIHDSGLDDTASAAKNGKNGEEGQNYSEDQHIADMLVDAEEDDEFQPDDAEDDIDNDSTLLEQEEEERRLASTTGKDPVRDEIDALQQEADLPIEELLARYKQRAKEEDEEEDEYDMESEADRESDGSSDHNHIVEDSSLVVRRKRKIHDSGLDDTASAAKNGKNGEEGQNYSEDQHTADMLVDAEEDDEFQPDDAEDDIDNDSTLLEQEEEERRLASTTGKDPVRDEIDALQQEADLPIEELLARYKQRAKEEDEEEDEYDMESEADRESDGSSDHNHIVEDSSQAVRRKRKIHDSGLDDTASAAKNGKNGEEGQNYSEDQHTADMLVDAEEDDEFQPDDAEDDIDNDSTLLEQEEEERRLASTTGKDPVRDEIDALQQEADLPIEELLARYKQRAKEEDEEEDEYDMESEADRESDGSSDHNHIVEDSSQAVRRRPRSDENSSTNLKDKFSDVQLYESSKSNNISRLEMLDGITRKMKVELPFLLSKGVKLRDYQHEGVSWLISLHDRRLNGILADEMGLGKTIQTIAALAYLACFRGMWGPHLIIVPTSCIVNWETEFKRFCPSFKVLTYFGSSKTRKNLRVGWSKLNSFHVCITSYQIVVQDAQAFRRKRWYYMILDEAHNIKNFKSKRWQTLLNFNTHRRLLLSGTPLQNNIMELWSLLHFLMPHLFGSRKEFSYWFNDPLSGMVEGNKAPSAHIVQKLHGIIKPFLLRRLKSEVAQQLPGKFEHILKCKLSKRQQYLYEEFMNKSTTKSSLAAGNYLSMMNVLMQLRKVCNHPDLFEPRLIHSPLLFDGLVFTISKFLRNPVVSTLQEQISPHLANIWNGKVNPFFVEDIHLSNITDSQNSVLSACSKSLLLNKYSNIVDQLISRAQSKNNNSLNHQSSSLLVQWHDKVKTLLIANNKGNYNNIDNESELVSTMLQHTPVRNKAYQQRFCKMFVMIVPKVLSKVKLPSMKISDTYPFKHSITPTLIDTNYILFPDKKMLQMDSGKLQRLALLLADLKKGGHKCLIFTQMSKMLDILEAFLSYNSYSFLRLDGSTSIDKRQRLMDKFNSDPRVFCFILSTRSGGLGINLTGADSVIFYDTDWNPAMDAQAQDRAHRIGQTRDVHIYRLVTEKSVEENILVKAQQKRKLGSLVMAEGDFAAAVLSGNSALSSSKANISALVSDQDVVGSALAVDVAFNDSAEALSAMIAAEDEEDVRAMREVQQEVKQDQNEFDEDNKVIMELTLEEDVAPGNPGTAVDKTAVINPDKLLSTANDEKEVESEFQNFLATTCGDFLAIESMLKKIELYAMKFRTAIEPFYSIYYLSSQNKLQELLASSAGDQWDVEAIELQKELDDNRAVNEGEIIAARLPEALSNLKETFLNQRKKKLYKRRLRQVTGECWSQVVVDCIPYWFNSDTNTYSLSKPAVIRKGEEMKSAEKTKFNGIAVELMEKIFSFLRPHPDRILSATVCARWNEAMKSECFHKKVLPVESGTRDISSQSNIRSLPPNTYLSIQSALNDCQPGDCIVLDAGHYWESDLYIRCPVIIMSTFEECTTCTIELQGTIHVDQPLVLINITIREAKSNLEGCLISVQGTKLMIGNCLLQRSSVSSSLILSDRSHLFFLSCTISGGLHAIESTKSEILFHLCEVDGKGTSALLHAFESIMYLRDTSLQRKVDTSNEIEHVLNSEVDGCIHMQNSSGLVIANDSTFSSYPIVSGPRSDVELQEMIDRRQIVFQNCIVSKC